MHEYCMLCLGCPHLGAGAEQLPIGSQTTYHTTGTVDHSGTRMSIP